MDGIERCIALVRSSHTTNLLIQNMAEVFGVGVIELTQACAKANALQKYEISEKTILDKYEAYLQLKSVATAEELKQFEVTPEAVRDFYRDAGESFISESVKGDVFGEFGSLTDESRKLYAQSREKRSEYDSIVEQLSTNPAFRSYLFDNKEYVEARRAEYSSSDNPSEYIEARRKANSFVFEAIKRFDHEANLDKLEKALNESIALEDKARDLMNAAEKRRERFFTEVVNGLLALSPISEEESKTWAEEATRFDSTALRRLKKSDYSPEEIKSDLAFLYRLVGGKLNPITFQASSASTYRASSDGRSSINVSNSFKKRTLFHEAGHILEGGDETLLAASKAFIKGRATGEPEKLRILCDNPNYKELEIAYPDTFTDPYVGKIYDDASEVVSMSLQCFSSSDDLLDIATRDEDHFKLILGELVTNRASVRSTADKKAEEFQNRKKAINDKIAREKAWGKALDKVAGKNFGRILLRDEGFNGLWMRHAYGNNCELFITHPDDPSAPKIRVYGKERDVRVRAYLYVAGHIKKLIPDTVPGLLDYCNFTMPEAPFWFDEEKGLPSLVDTSNVEKTQKKWKSELDRVANNKLQEKLKDYEGYKGFRKEGLSMPLCRFDGSHWNHVYIGETISTSLKTLNEMHLRYVYLFIANQENLLPVTMTKDQIVPLCKKGATAPDWFNNIDSLPEIV